ncbi:HNH endonuclease [Roseivirga spongicola]|uniref:HNH endonuclease n=1 Tax=Roseivirga spongicola TaxID=333140 RepID=A0A150XGE4_9BACT|nr:HNH endonuclease [Roseivirga spongicola]KYG77754.1 HNH endonuclease [Roseivirga spongicola]WPZ11481.1 HNH endonuclease [Roseivirga spongicola]
MEKHSTINGTPQQNEFLTKYLKVFRKLRIDRSHGIAPHKPILLLSIIQAYETKRISEPKIYLTPELVALFKTNWNKLVQTNHDCRISYPFFYMKSEGFWVLKPKAGFSNLNTMGSLVKSFANLNAAVEYAEIEKPLFELLNDASSRKALLQVLLEEYFPNTKGYFSEQDPVSLFNDLEYSFLNDPSEYYRDRTKELLTQKNDEEIFLRGSVFKREIPKIYDHSCCISGLRVSSMHNISMIDACHIIPFSESYDDTVTNGIALCPNLHRAFDRGLLSITPDFRVRVSEGFVEEGKLTLRQFEGQRISLPANKKYWPNRESLEWHGVNVFR